MNDFLPSYIAKRVVQKLIELGKNPGETNVLILGVTFKENVTDIRNSKVFALIKELKEFGVSVTATDPHANPEHVEKEYKVQSHTDLNAATSNQKYDAIVLAVSHDMYKNLSTEQLQNLSKDVLCLFDIKGVKDPEGIANYWKL